MKKLILSFIVTMMVMTGEASHLIGGDLTYRCVGGNDYDIILTIYRDCSGVGLGSPTRNITINSSCGSFNAVLNEVDLSPGNPGTSGVKDTSYLCNTFINATTCDPTGTYPGIEIYQWVGTVTLPPCADWTFDWSLGNRNPAFSYPATNDCGQNFPNAFVRTVNPSFETLRLISTMNNADGLCNGSPDFRSTPRAFICQGQEVIMDQGAIDPDGDSLSFQLVAPLIGNAGTAVDTINYQPGYSSQQPISIVPGTSFDIDVQTGLMSVFPQNFGLACPNPDSLEQSSMAVLVSQFRNGVLVGTTIRDIQIVTLPGCEPLNAVFQGVSDFGPGIQLNGDSVSMCAGDTLDFEVQVLDPDNPLPFELTTSLSTELPDLEFTTDTTIDTVADYAIVRGHFFLPTTIDDVGFYNVNVVARNNGCPVTVTEVFNITLEIIPSAIALAIPDTTCYNTGDSVLIRGEGGSNFTWLDLDGNPAPFDDPNEQNTFYTPTETDKFILITDVGAFGCDDRDTVTVTVVPPVDIVGDLEICLDDTTTLLADWDWEPTESLIRIWNDDDDFEDSTILAFTEGQYWVSITDTADRTTNSSIDPVVVCTVTDTVLVEIVNCPVIVPNIFTPNGDGFNDVFYIQNIEAQEWNLKIYNRWGRELLKEELDYQNDWDGGDLVDGTYYYVISSQDGAIITEHKGWFQIAR